MEIGTLDRHRRTLMTDRGPISYVELGDGQRSALFVHGLGTSAYLWRHVIEQLQSGYRCLALDFPLHGKSPARPAEKLSITALAQVVEDFCDGLDLDDIDLVANDTGGAVAQLFAVRHPHRLRTLTLTNCDTHDNFPPDAFKPTVAAAAAGRLSAAAPAVLADPARLRSSALARGFENPDHVDVETLQAFLEPVMGTPEAAREFERYLTSLDPDELVRIEPNLRQLDVPTLIVWGTADPFFELSWAYWLRDAIPGATDVVELAGATLFFPEQRAQEFAACLRRHWDAH